MFESGTLWKRLQDVTAAARASGAQRPLPTEYVLLEDQGIPFVVRILSVLEKKRRAGQEAQEKERATGRKFNPFLPYEKELFVADVSETHVCLLNKFNVIENHLLIVTRAFEEQEALLNLQDLEALWKCMFEFDGLGFYNGGVTGGASQAHKHLQLVPLPLADKGPRIPIDPALESVRFEQGMGTTSRFPYVHAFVRLPSEKMGTPAQAAECLLQGYGAMLEATGLWAVGECAGAPRQKGPYNLLVTREWMCLVPRSRERFGTISVNALGFAGALLVRNEEEMKRVEDSGPMKVLGSVGVRA